MTTFVRALIAALLTALASTACSSSGDDEADARIALSFARSATMWLDGWVNGAMPQAYVKRSLESAGEALAKLVDEHPRAHPHSPAFQIKNIAHDINAAHALAKGGAVDRARAASVLRRLRDSTAALDDWMHAHKGSGS